MTASVVEQVRQHVEEARQRGEQPPGRPTLVKLTGASEHAVRQALAELETAGDEPPPPAPPGPPAVPPAVESEASIVGSDAAEDDPPEPALEDTRPAGASPLETVTTSLSSGGDRPVTSGSRAARIVAWAGFVFGSVVSIAANVLAARVPPHSAAPSWVPRADAQVGAAVWPVALLLSVEVLSRVPWPRGVLWRLARYAGVGVVAAGSAVISYQHIRDVLLSWGYPPLSAGVGPLVIDGLMTASGFALLAIAATISPPARGPR